MSSLEEGKPDNVPVAPRQQGLIEVVLCWAGHRANRLDLLGQESHLWVGHSDLPLPGREHLGMLSWVEPVWSLGGAWDGTDPLSQDQAA